MNPDPGNCPPPSREIGHILLDIVDHLDAMVAYWDFNQVCVFANNAYRDWFGKSREEIIGITMQELLGPLYPKNLPYITAAFAGQTQVFEREIPTPDGRIRHSLATYKPNIVNGKVCGIFVHVADVGPLKQLEQELRVAKNEAEILATHDFLTGLPNRVLLLDRISQAISMSERTHHMVAVLSMDIDDFKKINDSFGHSTGDAFLIEIASRLTHALRKVDSVTRMGGDEFLLLAPEIESRAQVTTMAIRVLEHIKTPLKLADTILSPSCSLGIALYPSEAITPEALIARSDRALYRAKKLGKNRYAFAEENDGNSGSWPDTRA